jgi:hypothetical protein
MIAYAMAGLMLIQSPQQFDLSCTGTRTITFEGTQPDSQIYRSRIRLDLDRTIWCFDPCLAIQRVTQLSSTHIQLDQNVPDFGTLIIWIDRITGRMTSAASFRNPGVEFAALCEPAPYTEIPQARF